MEVKPLINVEGMTESVIPKKLQYKLSDSMAGLIKSRNLAYFKSDLSTYTPTDIMKFTINSQNAFIDGLNSYLKFNFRTSGPNWGVRGSLSKIIQRVRVTSGSDSSVICDISDMNLFDSILKENTYNKQYKYTAASVEGFEEVYVTGELKDAVTGQVTTAGKGTVDFRHRMTSNTTYVLPLSFIPLLHNEKLIPLRAFGSLNVELTLAPIAQCIQYHKSADSGLGSQDDVTDYLQANGAIEASYQVSNAEMVLNVLNMSDAVNIALDRALSTTGILLPVNEVWINNTNVQDSVQNSIQVNYPVYDNRSVHHLLRRSVNLQNLDQESFSSLPGDYFKNYQYSHSGVYYPAKPVSSLAEAYSENMRSFNTLNDLRYGCYSYSDFNKKNMLMSLEAERDGSSHRTGLSSKMGQLINFNYELSTNPGSALTLTTIVQYLKTVQVSAGGIVTISI